MIPYSQTAIVSYTSDSLLVMTQAYTFWDSLLQRARRQTKPTRDFAAITRFAMDAAPNSVDYWDDFYDDRRTSETGVL